MFAFTASYFFVDSVLIVYYQGSLWKVFLGAIYHQPHPNILVSKVRARDTCPQAAACKRIVATIVLFCKWMSERERRAQIRGIENVCVYWGGMYTSACKSGEALTKSERASETKHYFVDFSIVQVTNGTPPPLLPSRLTLSTVSVIPCTPSPPPRDVCLSPHTHLLMGHPCLYFPTKKKQHTTSLAACPSF